MLLACSPAGLLPTVRRPRLSARPSPVSPPLVQKRRAGIVQHAAPALAQVLPEAVPVWTLLAGTAAAAAVLEQKTQWGRGISSPLLAMALGCALAAGGVLPAIGCAAYDVVWSFAMPIASALLVMETRDMSRLRTDGGRLLSAFLIGAVGMFVGALIAALVLKPSHAVAACLCASYIGGSVNFIATAQALQLPSCCLGPTMAADNMAMGVILAALMACPLRIIRFFTAPETIARWRARQSHQPRGSSPDRSSSSSPLPGFQGEGDDSGMHIAAIQAALQRQVTIPARMSGKPVARDGTLLMTEEPAAATVWAAYQRSRAREAYAPFPEGLGEDTGSDSSSGNGSGGITPSPTPVIPPGYVSKDGSPGSDSPGSALASLDSGPMGSFDSGPLAKDGMPLLTAEPSPLTLQAAYARSRDTSVDSDGDEGPSGEPVQWREDERRSSSSGRLTWGSGVMAVVGAVAVTQVARAAVGALGCPHLFLLAVSGLALAASAAGGWQGRQLFAGASQLGSPLMGIFFATIGASCSVAGVSPGTLAPLLGFITTMTVIHWGVLLAGARALCLEPSAVLVASNTLVGGPATAAGMATSRGWGRLVQPAMLCGSLSYGIGSAAGVLMGLMLKTLRPV